MKKILRITESQLKRIVRKICENGETLTVDADVKNGDVNTAVRDAKQAIKSKGLPDDTKIAVTTKEVNESIYTKRQLKEAKKQMMLSNSRRMTKQRSRRR